MTEFEQKVVEYLEFRRRQLSRPSVVEIVSVVFMVTFGVFLIFDLFW